MKNETVFLCFSSKDRYEIVESIYYHLKNFGVSVWYDRAEILMGDNRNQKNFTEGVCRCNLYSRICAQGGQCHGEK